MTDARQSDLLRDARAIWWAGVNRVGSSHLVRNAIHVTWDAIEICGRRYEAADYDRLLVVGGGKAGAGMAAGVEEAVLGTEWAEKLAGWVNVPDDCVRSSNFIYVHGGRPAGKNEPCEEGVYGTNKILGFVRSMTERDLCLVLISGGGSALLPAPIEGVSLSRKQRITRALMHSGASIEELNRVRGALSRIKCGGLLRAAPAGTLISMIISDVVGDPLEIIASGPTVPTTPKPELALEICRRLLDRDDPEIVPVLEMLEGMAAGTGQQSDAEIQVSYENHILGSNSIAVEAAASLAVGLGYQVVDLGSGHEGWVSDYGKELATLALEGIEKAREINQPICLLSGGEPLVRFEPGRKIGKGGRNQELVLWWLKELWETPLEHVALLSGGTDGEDGPTDAAGGMIDERIRQAAHEHADSLDEILETHAAYDYLESIGGLLKTGPTHTNVMDLRVMVVRP